MATYHSILTPGYRIGTQTINNLQICDILCLHSWEKCVIVVTKISIIELTWSTIREFLFLNKLVRFLDGNSIALNPEIRNKLLRFP